MKIAGKKIEGLNEEHIFIPRGETEIHLIARAVVDFEEFDRLCPQPKTRKMRGRDGKVTDRPNDSQYDLAMDQWGKKKIGYLVVKSLAATPDLEFETVNINDSDTYGQWQNELYEAGFSEAEIARVLNGVMIACGLDESKVEAARKRFLTGRQEEALALSSPEDEALNTQSGELVSDSE